MWKHGEIEKGRKKKKLNEVITLPSSTNISYIIAGQVLHDTFHSFLYISLAAFPLFSPSKERTNKATH